METRTKATMTISAAVIAGVMAILQPSEGLRTHAYPDPANPHLATICYGETKDVEFGDVKTPQECADLLAKRLPDYLIPIYTLLPDLPDNRAIAYGDASYNMGVGVLTREAANGDSIVSLERAGRWKDACHRLTLFVYAGGQKLPGLVKRRQREYAVCMGAAA